MRVSYVLSLLTLGLMSAGSSFGIPGETGGRESSPPSAVRAASNDKSLGYPYVYRQVGYLATVGPSPMRFGPPSPSANERTPPRVPVLTRPPELKQNADALSRKAEEQAQAEAVLTYRSVFGRTVPVPAGASPGALPAPSAFSDQGGISTGSNEVMEFFQQPPLDPDAQKRQNRFLFDPIPSYQSAQPPASGNQTPSRATYQKN